MRPCVGLEPTLKDLKNVAPLLEGDKPCHWHSAYQVLVNLLSCKLLVVQGQWYICPSLTSGGRAHYEPSRGCCGCLRDLSRFAGVSRALSRPLEVGRRLASFASAHDVRRRLSSLARAREQRRELARDMFFLMDVGSGQSDAVVTPSIVEQVAEIYTHGVYPYIL